MYLAGRRPTLKHRWLDAFLKGELTRRSLSLGSYIHLPDDAGYVDRMVGNM